MGSRLQQLWNSLLIAAVFLAAALLSLGSASSRPTQSISEPRPEVEKKKAENVTTKLPESYVGKVGPGGYERMPYVASEWRTDVSRGQRSQERRKRISLLLVEAAHLMLINFASAFSR